MRRIELIKKKYNLLDDKQIKIAIIDSGIRSDYKTDNIKLQVKDYINNNTKECMHGTTILDIIFNFLPNAYYYIYKVINNNRKGNSNNCIKALIDAINKECNVINFSIAIVNDKVKEIISKITDYCKNNNIFLVCSGIKETSYPYSLKNSIKVVDNLFLLEMDNIDTQPDFVVNTPYVNLFYRKDQRADVNFTSTSFATAFISGLIGLVLINFPYFSYDQIIEKAKEINENINQILNQY